MIEVKNVSKRYGNNRGVKNLDFRVEKGEIVGFLGPNGAGKSTTMNILTGCKPPTSGSVMIGGFDISENPMEAKKKLGYLPDVPPLYPELKVSTYLKFVCELKGVKRSDRELHVKEIMELVNITDVKDRLIKNLSKGYKQRVGLAQALVSNPEFLILDEPTVGLDPKQILEMRTLIKNLGKSHTIILSSHILAEVSMICDRVIILKNGEIAAIDTPMNLEKNISASERFLARIKGPSSKIIQFVKEIPGIINIEHKETETPAPLIAEEDEFHEYIIENEKSRDVKTPLFFKMAENRYVIHELRTLTISLEDIFLELTSEQPKHTSDNFPKPGGGQPC